MNIKNNKKILLIPGWMNGERTYGENNFRTVLEIWKKRIDEKNKIEANWMIGHSLGANWTLLNWKKNKNNTKLILVNPLLPKRNILIWFRRWRKFFKEERSSEKKEVVGGFKEWFFGIRKCLRFLNFDFNEILEEVPKENIFILYGEKDSFYCDEKFKNYILEKSIKLIEVADAGHDWHSNFDEEIKKIIFN